MSFHLTERQYARWARAEGRLPSRGLALKYGNRPTRVDDRTFASAWEARHYGELLLRQRAGEIRNLACQTPIPIEVNGVLVAKFVADFTYEELTGRGTDVSENRYWMPRIVDTKSPAT